MRRFEKFLRLFARCMWVRLLSWSGCFRWAERQLRRSGDVVTLTFHRVLDDAAYQATNSLPGIVIRESSFQELLRNLEDRYEAVPLTDAVPGTTSNRIRVVVTFDDGWRDNYTTAFPLIRKHRVPVAVFVCPAVLGLELPFWPERALVLLRAGRPGSTPEQFADKIEEMKLMSSEMRERYLAELRAQARLPHASSGSVDRTLSWSEIAEMDKAGICFGSHTDSHQILTVGPVHMAREEVRQSKEALETALGKPCLAFAYPNGNWSVETRRIVSEIGFTRAITTQPGAWTSESDFLAIPRVNVSEDNVVGLTGRFWFPMFQYTSLWKAWRAKRRAPQVAPAQVPPAPLRTSPDKSAASTTHSVDSVVVR